MKQRRVSLFAKIRAQQGTLAAGIMNSTADITMGWAQLTADRAGVAVRRPWSRKGRAVWKQRVKRALMAEHLEGLQKVKAKQTQDRSDSLMLASLGGGVGQATKWERV